MLVCSTWLRLLLRRLHLPNLHKYGDPPGMWGSGGQNPAPAQTQWFPYNSMGFHYQPVGPNIQWCSNTNPHRLYLHACVCTTVHP